MKRSKKSVQRHAGLKRRPFLVVFLIIFIAIVALFVSHYLSRRPFDDLPKTEIITEDETEPENKTEESNEDIEESLKEPVQYEGEDPNLSASLTGTITTARVVGSTAIIRVNIDQYLSSGSCALELKSASGSYSDSANIVTSASTSTCEGFNIPVKNLASGTWQIEITISSGSKNGKITGEINL